MSHYFGIKAKVMVREEFKDIIDDIRDFSYFRNSGKIDDPILALLKEWYDVDNYIGCFNEKYWKYDRDTGIWEFEYYYNDRYYRSANIICECLLPYLIKEVISETDWDDWEGSLERCSLKVSLLEKREELVQDIINEIDERMEELKAGWGY